MCRNRILILLALLAGSAALATTVELVLRDGRVLSGEDVRRDGGDYVLTLESGGVIVLPEAVVEGVRLSETGKARQQSPTGLTTAEPQVLAGEEVRPPGTSEQQAVFGGQARFQQDIVDKDWQPSSDWDMDPDRQNNFAPSTWSEDIVDSEWEPESAFDENADVLANSRSTFQPSIVDNSWKPTDGFSN